MPVIETEKELPKLTLLSKQPTGGLPCTTTERGTAKHALGCSIRSTSPMEPKFSYAGGALRVMRHTATVRGHDVPLNCRWGAGVSMLLWAHERCRWVPWGCTGVPSAASRIRLMAWDRFLGCTHTGLPARLVPVTSIAARLPSAWHNHNADLHATLTLLQYES